MGKKMRVIGMLCSLFFALMQSSLASAATQSGNYSGGASSAYASPDSLPGNNSTHTESASANTVTGALSVSTAATSNSQAGFWYGSISAGGNASSGFSYVAQVFDVTPGTHPFSTTITQASSSASGLSGGNYYGVATSYSYGFVYLSLQAILLTCPGGSCQPDYTAGTYYANVDQYSPSGQSFTLSGSIASGSSTDKIQVSVSLVAQSYAYGQNASASASSNCTVSSISLT